MVMQLNFLYNAAIFSRINNSYLKSNISNDSFKFFNQ